MKPAQTGIARLSSTWGNTVSTNVAINAIGITIIQFPKIKYPIIKSIMNSAMIPSHAVSGNFFIQCFPNAIPKTAAAISPNWAIRITAKAILKSKIARAIIIPRIMKTCPPRVFSSFSLQRKWNRGIFLCSLILKYSTTMKARKIETRTSIAIRWLNILRVTQYKST